LHSQLNVEWCISVNVDLAVAIAVDIDRNVLARIASQIQREPPPFGYALLLFQEVLTVAVPSIFEPSRRLAFPYKRAIVKPR
jgi:hypothetical protein